MKTEVKRDDLTYHYSSCGKYYAEQETKHFFYLMEDKDNGDSIGQIDIKEKEFRFSDNQIWFKQPELIAITAFLTEVYDHYKHVK